MKVRSAVRAGLGGALMAALALPMAGCASSKGAEVGQGTAVPGDGPEDLWLEEVEGARALGWVDAQNTRSLATIKAHALFEPLHQRALQILTSRERLASPGLMGERVTNFWRDADHERGLWRVTTPEDYRKPEPSWKVLLDLDALAKSEGKNWVWSGARCRYPDYQRCLVSLSIGGADAAVEREFDVETAQFVDGGFALGESKSFLEWRDQDSVFYSPAFGEDEMTTSGYPRRVYIWQRNTPAEKARLVFEAKKEDMLAYGWRVWDGDKHHDFVVRMPGFYSQEYHWMRGEELVRLPLPEDASVQGIMAGQLLVQLRSDWEQGGKLLKQGALVAAKFEDVVAGTARFEPLFAPSPRQSVYEISMTRGAVLVTVLDEVVGGMVRLVPEAGPEGVRWTQQALGVPGMGSVELLAASKVSEAFYYRYTGFLTPTSVYEADAQKDTHAQVRAEPAWFNAQDMKTEQHFATSADGTRVPYFVVTPKGFVANGQSPTLLDGYGGFEVSNTPYYSGVMGASWLEKGGVYVLANIRGGGEFGPAWHQAALREKRQRAYDDFIAVAEDLVARNITSPKRLGIIGGSNGGLLVGAVMVQRPELFGAVVCEVPLLDMQRYSKLLAGASWMAEYGNPDVPEDWAFIQKYSPYQNVKAGVRYPRAFFTTSTRDDRVHPGHARRMVAKMMDQGHEVLYFENVEGGHGGAANQAQRARLQALIYSYLHGELARGE